MVRNKQLNLVQEMGVFLVHFWQYVSSKIWSGWRSLESGKGTLVGFLYSQRGRWARPFVHSGAMMLLFLGVVFGPTLIAQVGKDEGELVGAVMAGTDYLEIDTQIANEGKRFETTEYEVKEGDTVGTIAERFDVSQETILWANGLTEKSKLKIGQRLKILPVTGIEHTVKRGETVYSIASKYKSDAQAMVDFPFNTFANDETFALAVGQRLIVPFGVMPEAKVSPQYLAQTPSAGAVTATGDWVWPAAGKITQRFVSYHPGIDIANKSGPAVVAADAGKVVAVLSHRWGYGNHVIIDHGNGYQTLYAHMRSFSVQVGQTVNRGAVIGLMGSTGRSTGVHLHFEIRQGGIRINPLGVLK